MAVSEREKKNYDRLDTPANLFSDWCLQVCNGLKSRCGATYMCAKGSDRVGYNLICIADRVISIRVTTAKLVIPPLKRGSTWNEPPPFSVRTRPGSFAIIYRSRSRGLARFLRRSAFIPLYGRLQNDRGCCYRAKTTESSLSLSCNNYTE